MAAACDRSAPKRAPGPSDAIVIRDQVAQRNRAAGDQLLIQLVSVPGVCGIYNSGASVPARDWDIITIELKNTKAVLAAGKREVGDAGTADGTRAEAHFVGNRNCRMYYAGPATGTLDITAIDDRHVAGSYALTFAQGWPFAEHQVAGSFDLVFCAIDPNQVPTLTCK